MRIHMTAILGFAIAISVLAGGTAVGIREMNRAVRAQERHLRAIEHQDSLADQLARRADVVWSLGGAYADSGDPALLDRWDDESRAFASALHEFDEEADGRAAVSRSALAFVTADRTLRTLAREAGTATAIRTRFDTDLHPLRTQLERDLDDFDHRGAASFKAAYLAAEHERRHVTEMMYAGLAMLVAASLGVAWYFTRQLSGAFRKEAAATDAARQAIGARDELMGVVAHDLRNPLAAITLKAALLRQQAGSDDVRRQAESIETIALRMDYLIQTMLDVTTVEARRFSIQPAPCRAEGLLRDIEEMFDRVAESKQIRLGWKVTPPQLVVRADRERILQVLTNLVGNALKFTPSGGEVTITVEELGSLARFAVADSGSGIATQDLPKVFDRFWRKGSTSQRGTGLGLFIAKAITEAHGGRIWVESELGRGARFYFTLQLERAGQTEASPAEGALPQPA